ncbi:hypothetical protein A8A06_05290 [Escherichia coli]|nr:hypothetical protein [Escherichia coli]PME06199.1 hypothetical protein A8A06_05290 [Escherichia coli]
MPILSQFTPIWGNEQFTPGWKDEGFRSWNAKGIQKVKDLYSDGVLLTFDQLCQRYQISKKHFFKYLQLRSYISSKHKQIMCIPSLSKLEEMTLANLEGKGQLSKYYNMLVAHSTESTLDKLDAWRRDIQENIDESDWRDACLKAQKQTINTRFQLLQYKWLMRMYITPAKLHRMSANIPDVCTKCLTEKGTLFHCLWECAKIQNFWKDVIQCLSEMFNTKVPLNAKLCVLGIYSKNFLQTQKQYAVLDFGLLQARRAIALCWKSMDAPTMKMWMKELSECIGLERLTYIAKGKRKDFDKLWEPYINMMTNESVRFF